VKWVVRARMLPSVGMCWPCRLCCNYGVVVVLARAQRHISTQVYMYFRSRKTNGVEKRGKKGDAGNCNGSFAPWKVTRMETDAHSGPLSFNTAIIMTEGHISGVLTHFRVWVLLVFRLRTNYWTVDTRSAFCIKSRYWMSECRLYAWIDVKNVRHDK
jgi:hypothetical protein